MAVLTLYDPHLEFRSLRNAMDRLLQESFVWSNSWLWRNGNGHVPMDVHETADEYVVTASLPGWKPEDINISVQNNTLTISGHYSSSEQSENGKTYHLRERTFASFARSFTFATPIDPDKASASYENGVLTLTLPKVESARPKQIFINSQPQLTAPARKASKN